VTTRSVQCLPYSVHRIGRLGFLMLIGSMFAYVPAEGGFALVCGESGTGKSVALRIVSERLAAQREVVVGVLQRPQSRPADFYRELGDVFSVKLTPWNRGEDSKPSANAGGPT
jgi:hypothetical protein